MTASAAGAAAALVAGCTGADATEASLTVEDQSGRGQHVVVQEASAEEDYYVALVWSGGEETTDTFDAGTTQEDLEIGLEPAIPESATVEVSVHAAEDGEALASEEIQYEVPVEGSLEVESPVGGGRELVVDAVEATVDYYVAVRYDGQEVTTQTFEGGSTQEELAISLQPELERSRPLEVTVHAARDDEAITSETVDYEAVATLNVDGAEGEGTSVTIAEVGAEEDYYVDLHYRGETVVTETFAGGTTQEDLEIQLFPPIDYTRHVRVDVHADESGETLTSQTVQYKYRGAIMNVTDQSGDGDELVVDHAEATTDYYLAVQHDGDRTTSRTFESGTLQESVSISLDSPLEETTTVRVSIHAADDDEELYGKEIQYAVE